MRKIGFVIIIAFIFIFIALRSFGQSDDFRKMGCNQSKSDDSLQLKNEDGPNEPITNSFDHTLKKQNSEITSKFDHTLKSKDSVIATFF